MRRLSLVEVRPYNGMVYKLGLPEEDRDAHEQDLAATGAVTHVQEILFALCPSDAVLIDVGANVGSVTIPMAIRGFRVIAYDVLAENVQAIELGAGANRVQHLIQARHRAAWNENGELAVGGAGTLGFVQPGGNRTVRSARLDDDVPASVKVGAIKVDVEGAELNVLKGAERILRTQRPHVVFEVHPERLDYFGTTSIDLFEYLSALGYDIYRLMKSVLSPGYWPPAEQLVTDYLATTAPVDVLTASSGYAVRPFRNAEIVEQIRIQATLSDEHCMYVLAVVDQLPPGVVSHPQVSALLEDWSRRYAGNPYIDRMRRAVLGRSGTWRWVGMADSTPNRKVHADP